MNFETLLRHFCEVSACFWYTEGVFYASSLPVQKMRASFGCFWVKKCWFLIHFWCFVLDFEEYRVWFLAIFWLVWGDFDLFWDTSRDLFDAKIRRKNDTAKQWNTFFLKMQYIYEIYNKLKMSLVACRFAMCWYIFKNIIYIYI